MDGRAPREWYSLPYLNPEKILIELRRIEQTHPLHELHYHAASLRTRELRAFDEGRQAALFCYGMGQVLGTAVEFAQCEHQDYDAVARYRVDDEVRYVPIQLKEWVPDTLNRNATLQSELDKLSKYVDSQQLVVAFHLNRDATIRFAELRFPASRIGGLWFFGAKDPSQVTWLLIGDLLKDGPASHEFAYPRA